MAKRFSSTFDLLQGNILRIGNPGSFKSEDASTKLRTLSSGSSAKVFDQRRIVIATQIRSDMSRDLQLLDRASICARSAQSSCHLFSYSPILRRTQCGHAEPSLESHGSRHGL